MRTLVRSFILVAATATPALAAEPSKNLLAPNYGLMFWTLAIFIVLFIALAKFAFKPLTAAVEAREKALEDAIAAAKADRAEAAKVLAEHRAALDASRSETQKIIADAKVAGERVRAEIIEQAHTEQAAMMARVKQDIESEKAKAIASLRREAVELAIAGASKVIEKNLDSDGNRQLVESFLASVTADAAAASR